MHRTAIVNLKSYIRLARLEATSPMTGGIFYFLSGYFVRLVRTLLLLSIWRAVLPQTSEAGQLDQVLRYTLLAGVFWQQVDVETTASRTFWEGSASSRFLRPLNVFGQYMAETIGKWVPGLLFFSVPLLLVSPAPWGRSAAGLDGNDVAIPGVPGNWRTGWLRHGLHTDGLHGVPGQ